METSELIIDSYKAETFGIIVSVIPKYVGKQLVEEEEMFTFSYSVTIKNQSKKTIKLLTRHWDIYQEEELSNQVDGPGVVGKTPVLKPNDFFEYQSFSVIDSAWGSMEGTYGFIDHTGEKFDVKIPRFELVGPVMVN